MGSIYGKRFDAWWASKFSDPAAKADVERAALRVLWQIGLVILVVVVLAWLF